MSKRYNNIDESLHSVTFKDQQIVRNINTNEPPLQYIPKDFPIRKYVAGTIKSQAVNGQLKLLLRIWQSLNYICKDQGISDLNKKVFFSKVNMIYAGMASGRNMILIHEMYPEMTIEGIDPAPFDPDLIKLAADKKNNITLLTKFFTDDTAKEYYTKFEKNRNERIIIFVSDIRLETYEETVESDMRSQEKWTTIIKPDYSILKCRFPWDEKKNEKFNYLPGINQIQHFAPYNSTETALISKASDIGKSEEKDIYVYQYNMFYFNTTVRLQVHKTWAEKYYPGLVKTIPGMDYCNDCTGFLYTIHQYFNIFGINANNANMKKYVDKCIKLTHSKGQNMLSYYCNKQVNLTMTTKAKQLVETFKGLSDYYKTLKTKEDKLYVNNTMRKKVNSIYKELLDPIDYYLNTMTK
jgi:hypothetical protein